MLTQAYSKPTSHARCLVPVPSVAAESQLCWLSWIACLRPRCLDIHTIRKKVSVPPALSTKSLQDVKFWPCQSPTCLAYPYQSRASRANLVAQSTVNSNDILYLLHWRRLSKQQVHKSVNSDWQHFFKFGMGHSESQQWVIKPIP